MRCWLSKNFAQKLCLARHFPVGFALFFWGCFAVMAGVLNVGNRSVFTRDNLPILRGLNSDCADLIYLDPPFGSCRELYGEDGFGGEASCVGMVVGSYRVSLSEAGGSFGVSSRHAFSSASELLGLCWRSLVGFSLDFGFSRLSLFVLRCGGIALFEVRFGLYF